MLPSRWRGHFPPILNMGVDISSSLVLPRVGWGTGKTGGSFSLASAPGHFRPTAGRARAGAMGWAGL